MRCSPRVAPLSRVALGVGPQREAVLLFDSSTSTPSTPCSPCTYRIARSRRSACPTPPGWTKRRCGVPGSSAAWVAVCCGRKVAIFTWLHGKHVVGSSCDSSVLSVVLLYHVPKVCTRRIDGRTILGFVHSRIQRNPTPVISDSVSCFSLA